MEYSVKQEKPSTVVVEGFFYVRAVGFLVKFVVDDVGEILRVVLEALAGESLDVAEGDRIEISHIQSQGHRFKAELDPSKWAEREDYIVVTFVLGDFREKECREICRFAREVDQTFRAAEVDGFFNHIQRSLSIYTAKMLLASAIIWQNN